MAVIIELLKSMALGLVQGLGEFLPISSSGHLLLLQKAFGMTEGGLLFSILLHLATLVAVCIVYRRQIINLILHPIQKKTLWLILSTAVTVVIMFAFKGFFEDANTSGAWLGYCFIGTALLLTLAELARRKLNRGIDCNGMGWWRSAVVGVFQGIALLPGVSRSGATITGASLCGMERDDAAEFSFLLSIPAILGGAVLELPDLLSVGMGDFTWYGIAAGMLVAGISGYFAVRFMIRVITKKSFVGFIAYTAALGVFVILDQLVFRLINW